MYNWQEKKININEESKICENVDLDISDKNLMITLIFRKGLRVMI